MRALVLAQTLAVEEPGLSLNVSGGGSTAVKLFLLMTLLSFGTALLVSMTSFTRIVIVLGFVRTALGTPAPRRIKSSWASRSSSPSSSWARSSTG
jgi:flagellar biosynthetic protein FliP